MDPGEKSKNLCLIQYAHTITFKKRPSNQQKNLFTQKRIVAKGPLGLNKENEFRNSDKSQKFELSTEGKTSRSSNSPRDLSLNEKIEKLSFRNRNLLEVIRIREEKTRDELSKDKISLNSQVFAVKSEIQGLEDRKIKLLQRQKKMKEGNLIKIRNENKALQDGIENLTQKVAFLRKTMIEGKVAAAVKNQIKLLESYESEYIRTSQDLKYQLKKIKVLNKDSDIVQRYLRDKQELLEIFCVVSKLKYIILKRIEKVPIRIDEFEQMDRKVEALEIVDIVAKVLEKSKSLRMLVADKFAEDYTEGCRNM